MWKGPSGQLVPGAAQVRQTKQTYKQMGTST